jgi:hypothetical protein
MLPVQTGSKFVLKKYIFYTCSSNVADKIQLQSVPHVLEHLPVNRVVQQLEELLRVYIKMYEYQSKDLKNLMLIILAI